MFPRQFGPPVFGGQGEFGHPAQVQQAPPPFDIPGFPPMMPVMPHQQIGGGFLLPRQRRQTPIAAQVFDPRPRFGLGAFRPRPPMPGFEAIPGRFCGPLGLWGPDMGMPMPQLRGRQGAHFDPSRVASRFLGRPRTPALPPMPRHFRHRTSLGRRHPSFISRRPDERIYFRPEDWPVELLHNNHKSPCRGRVFDPWRSPRLSDGISPNQPPFDGYGDRLTAVLNQGDIIISGYTKIKSLARGGMSTAINLVKSQCDGKLYIEKRIRVDRHYRKRAVAEILALERIGKQYGPGGSLNTMLEYKISNNRQLGSLILEYCNQGSLEDHMRHVANAGGHFSEVSVWNIIQGVACGLAFLHDGITEIRPKHHAPKPREWDTICHLDLKPCNIFLHSEGGIGGQVKVVLADFGCAVTLSDIQDGREGAIRQPCGTPEWYPPEGDVQKPRGYGTKTDMWQLGATIHVVCRMLVGQHGTSPDRRILYSGAPIGFRYGERLNVVTRTLTDPNPLKRPAARDVAPDAIQVMMEKLGARR